MHKSDSSFTVISYEESKKWSTAFFFDRKEKNKVKKERVSKACDSCKIGHLSCNNERPCQRCIKSGKEDECIDHNSHDQKRTKRKREGIQVSERVESFINSTINLDSGDESCTSSGLSSLANSTGSEGFEEWYSSLAIGSKAFDQHEGIAVVDSNVLIQDVVSSLLAEVDHPHQHQHYDMMVTGCDVLHPHCEDRDKRR